MYMYTGVHSTYMSSNGRKIAKQWIGLRLHCSWIASVAWITLKKKIKDTPEIKPKLTHEDNLNQPEMHDMKEWETSCGFH